LYHAAPVCLIEELAVDEAMRGRGVGRALVTELLARLATTECEVSVAVMPDNTRALQFYKAQGLTEEAVFLEKHFGGRELNLERVGQGGRVHSAGVAAETGPNDLTTSTGRSVLLFESKQGSSRPIVQCPCRRHFHVECP
jgi:hypothetical protein